MSNANKNKENVQLAQRVEAVRKELLKDKSKADIMAKFGDKWRNVSSRTIDRYIQAAKEQIEADRKDQEQILAKAKEAELEALKDEILTDIECDVMLSRIARGHVMSKKVVWDSNSEKFVQVDEYPSARDKITAISELYKRRGSYAPTKGKLQLELDGVDEYEVIGDDNVTSTDKAEEQDKP